MENIESDVLPGKNDPGRRFPIWKCVVLTLVFGVLVFAPTILIPFYISDDADIIRYSREVLDGIKRGEFLKPFQDKTASARNFPGAWYYFAMMSGVFGKSSIMWHIGRLLTFAAIGFCTTFICWRITRSIIPGLVAYVFLISTGEAVAKSNWDNLLNLVTFEPILILLWILAACLVIKSSSARNLFVRALYVLFATVCILWSLIFKETSFLIVGAVAGFIVILLLIRHGLKVRSLAPVKGLLISLAIILIAAAAWGFYVYVHLAKGSGYAGTSTLQLDFKSLYDTYKKYQDIIINQSDYLIPLGLCIGVLRLVLGFRAGFSEKDAWQIVLFVAGCAQLLTLLVWPYVEGRYVQPAYLWLFSGQL